MPTLSTFYGIKIMMYWNDHTPPHFHAQYSGDEALIGIQPIQVIEGRLPRRARSLVFEWAAQHQEKLVRCWQLAQEPAPSRRLLPSTNTAGWYGYSPRYRSQDHICGKP